MEKLNRTEIGESDESRVHLYIACAYTYTIWVDGISNLFETRVDYI